ncbi:MAG: redoxin domain-containing protein [Pirellulales bacterium]|nr:redoxin domain-containing protein [Pirellulales bacterium]
MRVPKSLLLLSLAWNLGVVNLATAADNTPTVKDAMALRPVQPNVEFDVPADDKLDKCTLKQDKSEGHSGWVVRGDQGQLLRRFVDTNGDNTVDMWCYYQDGLEAYRDVDSDFNGKADQCRWLNLGGTRWGIDKNEDGTIDTWKAISPEEASAELVWAMGHRDTTAFQRILLTAEELETLGLGATHKEQIAGKIKAAAETFSKLAAEQQLVTDKSRWVSFGAVRPGVVPQGTQGSTGDLVVYENVVAMIDTDKTAGQVLVGTLIKIGDVWRAIDAPKALKPQEQLAGSGFFFDPLEAARADANVAASEAPDEGTQKLLAKLEELDKQGEQSGEFSEERAELLKQLAEQSQRPEEKAQWLRQLADMLSAAAQGGNFPEGVEQLKQLFDGLGTGEEDKALAGYVKFRYLSAEYSDSLQQPKANFAEIQTNWLKNLEQYVTDYPQSAETAEALLQLAIAQEFAGQEDEAKKWFNRIVQDFPELPPAKKAAGAIARLESVGKQLEMSGKTVDGKMLELSKLRGKVVLIHYWATWCEPCKADMATIKELYDKIGGAKGGFVPVGINLDASPESLAAFLKQNAAYRWPHLYEPGGLESRLANELGILTLPTMLLVDPQGRVANRGIHVSELESEIKKLLQPGVASDSGAENSEAPGRRARQAENEPSAPRSRSRR